MGNASPAVTLSRRSQAILAMIADTAARGDYSPTGKQIADRLRNLGMSCCDESVAYDIGRLIRARHINITGSQRKRVFHIMATGHRTMARPSSATVAQMAAAKTSLQRRDEQAQGWPKRGPLQAASYDAAIARREFALHEWPSGPRPIGRVAMAPQMRSLTGNSSQMVAAS